MFSCHLQIARDGCLPMPPRDLHPHKPHGQSLLTKPMELIQFSQAQFYKIRRPRLNSTRRLPDWLKDINNWEPRLGCAAGQAQAWQGACPALLQSTTRRRLRELLASQVEAH